jgi:hypothetical protein
VNLDYVYIYLYIYFFFFENLYKLSLLIKIQKRKTIEIYGIKGLKGILMENGLMPDYIKKKKIIIKEFYLRK